MRAAQSEQAGVGFQLRSTYSVQVEPGPHLNSGEPRLGLSVPLRRGDLSWPAPQGDWTFDSLRPQSLSCLMWSDYSLYLNFPPSWMESICLWGRLLPNDFLSPRFHSHLLTKMNKSSFQFIRIALRGGFLCAMHPQVPASFPVLSARLWAPYHS